jgi:hypothetical protein
MVNRLGSGGAGLTIAQCEDRHLIHDDQLTAPSRSRVPFQEAGLASIVETIPRLRFTFLCPRIHFNYGPLM